MKALAPNSLIQNRYLIVHLIGKGGMGEVYLAVDQRLGSAVALKRTFFADDEMLGGAFEREARTLARLRHPVLPKVSDHFTENGEQYLVMEHIAGDDLSKRLEAAQKPFPLSWVLFWADQLLDALAYLHSHEPPIIHRDIKPQNLKLTDENHIILLDFGLSKNTAAGKSHISESGRTSGSSGSVVGYTPHYAPMEQIRGTGTDPRSDLYSLSATLYQLMTDIVPADALTRADALLNGDADPIKPLNEVNPEISRDVSDVILRGMEVSQEKRFGTAKEMQKILRKAYSEMQEAMTAQTVAFTAPGEFSSKIEQPAGIANIAEPRQDYITGQSEEANQLSTEPNVDVAAVVAASDFSNQDATVQYDGPIDITPKQADVKTEVYHAGNTPFISPGEEPPGGPDFVETPTPIVDEWSVPAQAGNGANSPDATVPNIAFESGSGSTYETAGAYSVPSDASPESYATESAALASPQRYETAQPPTVAAPAKKKSSKAVWVVGGLAALFIMAVVTAGAGWFVYTNYYASVAPEPTPSPQPTLVALPSPEPTIEAAIETNSNSSTAQIDTNSNSSGGVLVVSPTPVPEIETGLRESNPNPRQSPQVEARKTPTKASTGQTGAKPTPKPKTSDRTVILQ